MNTSTNIQLVQNNYMAFSKGDMNTFFGNLSDHFVWESLYPEIVPYGGVYVGKQQVDTMLQSMGRNLDIRMFSPEEFFINHNKVVVIGQETAIVKNTGKTYHQRWVHIWEVDENHKLTRITSYNDTDAIKEAFLK